jgi:hypothetical protein
MRASTSASAPDASPTETSCQYNGPNWSERERSACEKLKPATMSRANAPTIRERSWCLFVDAGAFANSSSDCASGRPARSRLASWRVNRVMSAGLASARGAGPYAVSSTMKTPFRLSFTRAAVRVRRDDRTASVRTVGLDAAAIGNATSLKETPSRHPSCDFGCAQRLGEARRAVVHARKRGFAQRADCFGASLLSQHVSVGARDDPPFGHSASCATPSFAVGCAAGCDGRVDARREWRASNVRQ